MRLEIAGGRSGGDWERREGEAAEVVGDEILNEDSDEVVVEEEVVDETEDEGVLEGPSSETHNR